MLHLVTFSFFIGYLAFLWILVWLFVHRFLAPRVGATRGEALAVFYAIVVVSLVFLILVNYHTGFLAEFYRFFDALLFEGRHSGGAR